MAETVTTKATDNYPSVQLPIDSLEQEFVYDGDDLIAIFVQYRGVTYSQQFTWSENNLVAISQWSPPS